MKLLAVETSTEACSTALLTDGHVIHRFEIAPRRHTELILGMVDNLLHESDLSLSNMDALAFGCGPGSFTGLRIAAGVIQGLAFGADLPVVPISSLAALAQGTYRERGEHNVLAVIDARMSEVYWGTYQYVDGIMQGVDDDRISRPDQVNPANGSVWFGVGSGWDVYARELQALSNVELSGYATNCFPHARDVLTLSDFAYRQGKAVPAEEAMPVYLRDKVAIKSDK